MEEKKTTNSNIQPTGVYVIIFIAIIGVIIGIGILFSNNKSKLTDDELFVAESIYKYKGNVTDCKIKEIRLYEESERL